jgi:hypothetical protein
MATDNETELAPPVRESQLRAYLSGWTLLMPEELRAVVRAAVRDRDCRLAELEEELTRTRGALAFVLDQAAGPASIECEFHGEPCHGCATCYWRKTIMKVASLLAPPEPAREGEK